MKQLRKESKLEHSEQINELATALAKAQGDLKGAKKDSKNPFFHSSYADLASVWDACREPLSKNGLSVVQTTDWVVGEEHCLLLLTTLLHSSGQWITGKLLIKPVKDDPQGLGSAITYARRYALSAIVGVAAEDDDAESAMGRKSSPPDKQHGYHTDPEKSPFPSPPMATKDKPAVAPPEMGAKTSAKLWDDMNTLMPKLKWGTARLKAEAVKLANANGWPNGELIAQNGIKELDPGQLTHLVALMQTESAQSASK